MLLNFNIIKVIPSLALVISLLSCSNSNKKTNFLDYDIKRTIASTATLTYGEGSISSKHDSEFSALKNKYILTKGKIDLAKVKKSISYLTTRRVELHNSVFLYKKDKLIKKYGYSNKKATKKVTEEIEEDDSYLFLYNEVLASMAKLKANSSNNEVQRITLLLSATENFHQTHLLTEVVNTAKNLGNFLKKMKLNDINALEASNLIKDNNYLSANEIKKLKQSNFDISTLNPPNGPIWVNNKIKNYDPFEEELYEKSKIPKEGAEFYYKRMGSGQIKLKAYYLNKKGKKKSVNIKTGREVHAQLYTSQLARILGYSSLPVVFRKNIKLFLGDNSYSEFTIAWDRAHVGAFSASASAAARSWFSRAGRYKYNKEDHSVTIIDGFIETYPSKGKYYYKGNAFKSSRHGFVNRREYRALFLFSALINLVDNGDKNTRLDAVRDSKDGTWKPFFYFNDLGTSMGNWYSSFNTMSVNEFGEKLAYLNKDNEVHIKYISRHPHPKTFSTATANDYKWLIRRMSEISHKQLIDIGLASGLPDFLADLYAEKIKRRINNLIETFKVNDLQKINTIAYRDLHSKHPNYITKSGKLTAEADNFDNNTWYTGPSATLTDIIQLEGSNLIHKSISSLLKLELPVVGKATFYNQIGGGLSLTGTRAVNQNNFHGPGQRRVQIHDKWQWGLPLGVSHIEKLNDPVNNNQLYLPLGVNLNYEISHFHSAPSIREANTKNYKDILLPWQVSKIKSSLKIGESIRILESINYTIGGIKGQISDQFRLQLDALRYAKLKLKEIYIHRYSENELEVVIQNINETDLHSGFDIKFFLELAISAGRKETELNYNYARLDLEKADEQQTQELYKKILTTRKIEDIDNNIGSHIVLNKKESKKYFGWKFLLWGYQSNSTGTEYDIRAVEKRVAADKEADQDEYQIFSHSLDKTYSRALKSIWSSGQVGDNDIKEKSILNSLNILLQFFDRENKQVVTTYAQTDEDILNIKDLSVYIDVNRSNNYIKLKDFKKRYINYYSQIVGENAKSYFNYSFKKEQEYFSPVKSNLNFQVNLKGITRLVDRLSSDDDFCKGEISCELSLSELTKVVKYTSSLLKKKYKTEKRKRRLRIALAKVSSFFEYIIGHKAYKLKELRKIVGDKNLWITTRITGVLPNAHPFAIGKNLPLYSSEIGSHQGLSPLKKVILKYQFFPKQNFFYDSLLPEVPY